MAAAGVGRPAEATLAALAALADSAEAAAEEGARTARPEALAAPADSVEVAAEEGEPDLLPGPRGTGALVEWAEEAVAQAHDGRADRTSASGERAVLVALGS